MGYFEIGLVILFATVVLLNRNLLGPIAGHRTVARIWRALAALVGRFLSIGPAGLGVLAGIGMLAIGLLQGSAALLGFSLVWISGVLFAGAWAREFRSLMRLTDADFPGRFDKPIWAALLIFAPPVGVLTFGAYRRATWPEPKPAMAGDLA